MAGGHAPEHIAALVAHLPTDAALFVAENPDAAWTREAIMLADIRNNLVNLMWSMGNPRKRGARPKPIGPSWMTKGSMRSLQARALPVDELLAELAKPRKTSEGVI